MTLLSQGCEFEPHIVYSDYLNFFKKDEGSKQGFGREKFPEYGTGPGAMAFSKKKENTV